MKQPPAIKKIAVELLPAPPSQLMPATTVGRAWDRTDRIVAYHRATRLAEATKKIAAFFTGVELITAKEEIGHGKFLEWCEAHLVSHGLSYRTAARYMKFAEPHLPRWIEMTNGKPNALLLTNGLVSDDTFQSACEFLKDADDGKLFAELSRDFGLSRLPTHQKDRDNTVKQTPAEAAAARQQAAETFADLLVAHDLTFCADNKSTHLLHADLSNARIKEILDAGLTRNRVCKDILKSRKPAAAKKKARKAKGANK